MKKFLLALGITLLAGGFIFTPKAKSEFDVNSLNDQVQVHEERLNQIEPKLEETVKEVETIVPQVQTNTQKIIEHEVRIERVEVPIVQPEPVVQEPVKEPVQVNLPGETQHEVDVHYE